MMSYEYRGGGTPLTSHRRHRHHRSQSQSTGRCVDEVDADEPNDVADGCDDVAPALPPVPRRRRRPPRAEDDPKREPLAFSGRSRHPLRSSLALERGDSGIMRDCSSGMPAPPPAPPPPPPQPQPPSTSRPSLLLGMKSHSFRSKVRRRTSIDVPSRAGLEGSGFAGGLGFADRLSFRRLSLDGEKLRAQLTGGDDADSPSSVSNFQEVFRQMKREHPAASLLALRQMTMARIAEDKARREEEEERRKEEERLRHQTRAKKYVDMWVGRRHSHDPPPPPPPSSHPAHHHLGGSGSRSRSDSLDDSEAFVAHVVPTGVRASAIFAQGLMPKGSRRSSVDSGGVHSSLDPDGALESLQVRAGLVPGGDDQAGNFAPRKSVGDMSRMGGQDCGATEDEDNKSCVSGMSDASGLFVDAESLASGMASAARLLKAEDEEKAMACPGKARRRNSRGQDSRTTAGAVLCSLADALDDTQHTRRSEASEGNQSRISGNTLIVKFGTRGGDVDEEEEEEDEDDGLIVGFGDRGEARRELEEDVGWGGK